MLHRLLEQQALEMRTVIWVMLCLTQVEASVDLKELRSKVFLKGIFKNQGCWGLPQQLLATSSCFREFKVKL